MGGGETGLARARSVKGGLRERGTAPSLALGVHPPQPFEVTDEQRRALYEDGAIAIPNSYLYLCKRVRRVS